MRLLSNEVMLGAVALTVSLQLTILYVPFCNELFSTQPLTAAELGLAVAVASGIFWVVEAQKLLSRRQQRGAEVEKPLFISAAGPAAGLFPLKVGGGAGRADGAVSARDQAGRNRTVNYYF